MSGNGGPAKTGLRIFRWEVRPNIRRGSSPLFGPRASGPPGLEALPFRCGGHTTPSPRARGQSISSMAGRSLSPRTIVPRIEASVIGRLANWNPGSSRHPSQGQAPRADREAGLEDEPASPRSEPRAITSKPARVVSHPTDRSARPRPPFPASSRRPASPEWCRWRFGW